MLATLFNQPAWVLPLLITLLLGATGAVIHWISFAPAWRARTLTFVGLVGPFFGSPAILFALLTGFLANDAWIEDRRANALALEEHDAITVTLDLAAGIPGEATRVQILTRDYVQSVITDEWPTAQQQKRSPKTSAALGALLHEVTLTDLSKQTTPAVQSALINAVQRITAARSGRLATTESSIDDAKWLAALALAVLSQVGAAAVHLERKRVQALALAIFTVSAIVLLALIATCERPYLGEAQGEFASLREFLTTAPGDS